MAEGSSLAANILFARLRALQYQPPTPSAKSHTRIQNDDLDSAILSMARFAAGTRQRNRCRLPRDGPWNVHQPASGSRGLSNGGPRPRRTIVHRPRTRPTPRSGCRPTPGASTVAGCCRCRCLRTCAGRAESCCGAGARRSSDETDLGFSGGRERARESAAQRLKVAAGRSHWRRTRA